jgi:UDP-2,3-diacylglucosamine pyrophosphatase LpxH
MNDLRKAAEMALKYFEDAHGLEDAEVAIKEALRQALTPEVTPEVPCKTDPRAPHGFDRNASHSADRYVCECEGWEPPKREWVGLTKEDFYKKDDETVFVLGMKFAEARLRRRTHEQLVRWICHGPAHAARLRKTARRPTTRC